MTNDRAREIVDTATEHAVRDSGARRLSWTALILLVVFLAVGAVYFGLRFGQMESHSERQDQRISEYAEQADENAKAAQALEDQVRALGAAPVADADAPPGGSKGPAGVGVAAAVPGDCSVTIKLTDLREYTVDDLCGADGANGEPGLGIASTTTDDCFVQVAYTDKTTSRLGPFCGPRGPEGKPGESPPCLSEPNQCRGERGAKGEKGDTGAMGPQGEPGPTCPEGYELRDAIVTTPDDRTYEGKACVDPSTEQEPGPGPPLNGTR